MPAYPLIFRFSQSVQTDAFLARVSGTGRVLMVFEDDDWWCHGVCPAALSQNGLNPVEAYERFRLGLRWVLEDSAVESSGFDDFRARVQRFFEIRDDHETQRWQEAVEGLRAPGTQPEAPFDSLQRIRAEEPCRVSVELLGNFAQVEETIALAQAA